jgi:hypothetical protein
VSHVIQQIRAALAAALNPLTTTGARVYTSRTLVNRLKTAELPALFIGLPSERITIDTIHFPPAQEREMDVAIIALAKDGDDTEETLTDILAEVETKLYSTQAVNTLSGLIRRINLNSIDPDIDTGLDLTAGQLVMTWNALYYTAGGAPQTAT